MTSIRIDVLYFLIQSNLFFQFFFVKASNSQSYWIEKSSSRWVLYSWQIDTDKFFISDPIILVQGNKQICIEKQEKKKNILKTNKLVILHTNFEIKNLVLVSV